MSTLQYVLSYDALEVLYENDSDMTGIRDTHLVAPSSPVVAKMYTHDRKGDEHTA
jgi:hypothetical protein